MKYTVGIDLGGMSAKAALFDERDELVCKKTVKTQKDDGFDGTAQKLAELAKGYVGAEIEQITISAMYEAFYADRGLCKEDVIKCIKETVPLSITQKEQILHLREWARERAVLATAPEDRELSDPGDSEVIGRQGGRIVDFDL